MYVDLVIKNGRIFGKESTAVAIKGAQIVKVGSDTEIDSYIKESTNVIDAAGNTIIPTFVDAHMHPSMTANLCAGLTMYHIVRQDDESREDYIVRMMEVVEEYVKNNPNREIIIGYGWYPAAFSTDEKGRPTRHDIDKVCADKPVVLRSFDGHAMLVNSKALELAGLDKNTPDPKGGMFGREEDGSINGNVYEFTAMEVIFDNLENADFTVEEYEEGILAFQNEHALPNGVTTVFDALIRPNAIRAFNNLAKDGRLKLKVSSAWVADPAKPEEQFDEMIRDKGIYDVEDKFYMKTVKFFVDGGAFGFLTNEPFEGEFLKMNGMPEDYCGESLWTSEELNSAFLKLSKAGYQIHVHCMGDGAVTHTLDAFEYVYNQGVKGNRNVITHIMNITDSDVERMKKLDVIAAMQPSWPIVDSFLMYGVIPLFGEKRAYEQYPLGRLHDAGIMVTSSTDFPVTEDINPLLGIQCSMTRRIPKSHSEYEQFKDIVSGLPDNLTRDCMSLSDLIDSYTLNGAYQLFTEDQIGSIEEGKSANILVLDQDITGTDVMEIENVKIESMIVEGQRVK